MNTEETGKETRKAAAGFGAAVIIGAAIGIGLAMMTHSLENHNITEKSAKKEASKKESAKTEQSREEAEMEVVSQRITEDPEATMELIKEKGQENFTNIQIDGMNFEIGLSIYQDVLDAFGVPDDEYNYYSSKSNGDLQYTHSTYYFDDPSDVGGLEKCRYMTFIFCDLQDGALEKESRVLMTVEIVNEHGDLSYDVSFDENASIDFCEVRLLVNDKLGAITNETTSQDMLAMLSGDGLAQADYTQSSEYMKEYIEEGYKVSIEFTDQGRMPEPKALYRVYCGFDTKTDFFEE